MRMFDSQATPECILPVGSDQIAFEKATGTLQAFSFSVRRPNYERGRDRCFEFRRLIRLAMRNWLRLNGTFDSWTSSVVRDLPALRKSAKSNDLGSQCLPHAVELLSTGQLQAPQGPRHLPQIFISQKLKE